MRQFIVRQFIGLSVCGLLLAAGCVSSQPRGAAGSAAESADVLPSAQLSAFVEGIELQSSRGLEDEIINVRVASVSSDSVYRPAIEAAQERGEEGIDQPIQIGNELIVLFRPDLSPDDAAKALADYRLVAIGAMPQIGALVIDTTNGLAELAISKLADSQRLANSAAGEPINRSTGSPMSDRGFAALLMSDRRFAAVAVNSVLTSTSIASAITPVVETAEQTRGIETASRGADATIEVGEQSDWGVAASKIDAVWPLLTQTIKVGVIDVGFANHVDLPIVRGLRTEWTAHDHGNHVAGIMCARHNGVGVKGVLPNCEAAAASGEMLLDGFSPIEGSDAIAFQARFSEYLSTVLDFMEANPDAKVINLSLGYNWMPNFDIDPREDANAFVRDLVRSQGRMFQSILAYAKRRDIAIFAAAGNDSTDLRSPLEAEWASPFNFGSKLMQDADGWTNGVIVEAYGRNQKRARFSNVAGHISCPGVDIKSAIARPVNAYGAMSGTSMASPYCAAAFAAMRALQPEIPLKRSIDCFLNPPSKIDGRIPRMDLKASFEACRDEP